MPPRPGTSTPLRVTEERPLPPESVTVALTVTLTEPPWETETTPPPVTEWLLNTGASKSGITGGV